MALNANSFGQILVANTFGESHGHAMGAIINGCPAGVSFDEELIKKSLQRRKPGQVDASGEVLVTARVESEQFEVLSGVYQNKTLGTPIAIIVRNNGQRSSDYNEQKLAPRNGHADDMWRGKFLHSDPRGGGRSSGRETLSRVLCGAISDMILRQCCETTNVIGYVQQIGPIKASLQSINKFFDQDNSTSNIDTYPARFIDSSQSKAVISLLKEAPSIGKSYGGVVAIGVFNRPIFLGQPIFHKLKSDIAQGLMSLGASYSFELGSEFKIEDEEGSDFHQSSLNTHYGGVRGGISTGETIILRVKFKPTASVNDVAKTGRHDPCIAIRAVPVVESIVKHVIADHFLWQRLDRI